MTNIFFVMHRVDCSSDLQKFEDVSLSFFEAFLNVISNQEKIDVSQNHKNMTAKIHLTFDDGNESDFHNVFPRLIANRRIATFFIIPSRIGKRGYLNWKQLQEMHQSGMKIGSHTLNHVNLTRLSNNEKQYELEGSRALIEDKLGAPINNLSAPFGLVDKATLELASRCGYEKVFSSKHGIAKDADFLIPRNSINCATKLDQANKYLSPNSRMLLYWRLEDRIKKHIRHVLGDSFYKRIRNAVLLKNER